MLIPPRKPGGIKKLTDGLMLELKPINNNMEECNLKIQFSTYMKTAPEQLKKLFMNLNESDAIMLQCCFHDFSKQVIKTDR